MPFDDFNNPPPKPNPFLRPEVQIPPVHKLDYQPPRQQPRTGPNVMGGAIRLFQVFGITVSLHWSWFLVAAYEIEAEKGNYSSILWNIAEYLCLFLIVLMHEFGHALACRSVGGKADRIILWPLGGVAFVSPPPRPGAPLWSIAAGPLVNVILLPVTMAIHSACAPYGGDIAHFTYMIMWINRVLLIFNILPIYPLDGGQILQALLWFILGRAWSLMVAACVGILGAVAVLGLAAYTSSYWFAILAFFGGSMAWRGIRLARVMMQSENAPRRPDARCPNCGTHPPMLDHWSCSACGNKFDTFATGGQCPRCGAVYNATTCSNCGKSSALAAWRVSAAAPPNPAGFTIPQQPPPPY